MTKLVIAVLLASCASILVSADPSQGQSADEEAIKQIERYGTKRGTDTIRKPSLPFWRRMATSST